jgi:photosystem II stability/assembly factor-like uncharacterized protein/predicted esterase
MATLLVVAIGCTGGSDGMRTADANGKADDDAGCSSGEVMDPATAACVATCNPTGLLHAQSLEVDSVERHYMLYVPSSYRCDGPAMPLLIDFHGTWTGAESDNGEEFYALPGLLAEADVLGFIVARPRSLYSAENGENVYRWDENPGDYARNAGFAHALVQHLEALYRVDPSRVYAFGFSSGTGMAAQFFSDDPTVFHGYAFVGGGYWATEPPAPFHLDPAARMYGVTGYRDYLYAEQQVLLGALDRAGYPRDQFFQRTDTNGHELYRWHYDELMRWIDSGTRPNAGALGSAWQAEATGATEDLTAIADDASGGQVATGSLGGIYHRDPASGWSKVTTISGNPALSGVCLMSSGIGVAVGESFAARTTDHGESWTSDVTIPAYVPGFYNTPYINAVGCSSTKLVAVGYWDAAHTSDATTWAASSADNGGYASQGAQVKASAAGTFIATGYYDYIGRSSDGVTFTKIQSPVDVQWLMGIASAPGGRWWVVGEAGTMLASTNDGMSWTKQTVPTAEDLYGVAFHDAQRGVAVGNHGAVIITTNGGATWTSQPTGLDGYVGDVAWLDANHALVIGAGGLTATLAVN